MRLLNWIISKIKRLLSRRKFIPKRKPIFLSWRIRARADRKFNKRLNIFKQRNKRKPTKNELVRIAINASHTTIRKRGKRAHWQRQKIRKYVLEKRNIVKNFKMK